MKTFWVNGLKPSVSDGYLWSMWPNFFSFWHFSLHKAEVETEALVLLFLRRAYMKYLHWLTGESPDLSHFWWEKNFGSTWAESNSWIQKHFFFFPQSFILSLTLISKLSLLYCKHVVFKILHCSKVICMWVYFILSTSKNVWT